MDTGVENLIHVINKLQDTFASLGSSCPIDLPQIAVVGEQSAGKSSVLENFVGRDFLPRGSGIVTRRPLVLQLINQSGPEYATFLHTKEKRFVDFLEVRREIELETDRLTGSNKNISAIPINLRIYSPNVLNLTLIDLPGLTKVPVGDQPKDIEQQIRSMILTYISNPNCLILAVTPAVIDLANSEALKMAREVDPEGERSIGVITKIDMLEEGTDCKPVLENQVFHRFIFGYVGIVNRSQRDIDGKKDIKTAQSAELAFFENHPVYKHMSNRMGSKYLQVTLNNQLSQHIKETLPSLKQKIMEELSNIEKTYGSSLGLKELTTTQKTKIFMTSIQEFSKKVDIVLGYQQEFVDTKEISGGSVINKILYQRFPYELSKTHPDPVKMRNEIKMAIINSQGVRSSIFTPDVAFTSVVKKHIQESRGTCVRITDLISSEILKILEKSCHENFSAYPNLLSEILGFCQGQLNQAVKTTKGHTHFYIDTEIAHINVRHPDFVLAQQSTSDDKNNPKIVNKGQENTTYKKGNLTVTVPGFIKSTHNQYFVLKGSALTSYKDERCQDQKMQVLLDNCRIKDHQSVNTMKKNNFVLYNREGKNIGKDITKLDLSTQTSEEAEEWKAAFMAAGVATDTNQSSSDHPHGDDKSDQHLIKQVEYIYSLVESYLKIVNKNQVDIISKMCVYCIITHMRKIILTDIVAHVYSSKPIDELMSESEETLAKRREVQQIYNSCKEAIQIIQNVMSNMGIDSKAKKFNNFQKKGMDRNYVFESEFSTHSDASDFSTIAPRKPPRPPVS